MTFLEHVQAKWPKLVKVGKVTGQVRLTGKAYDYLREFVWHRDGRRCVVCKAHVSIDKGEYWSMNLAHIRSKGAGHDDLPENTVCCCLRCHMASHTKGFSLAAYR